MKVPQTSSNRLSSRRQSPGLAVLVFYIVTVLGVPLVCGASAGAGVETGQPVPKPATPPLPVSPAAEPAVPPGPADPAAQLAERWGVKVESLRLSAAGYMLDFRFRVLDPVKAAPLFNKSLKTYLLDETSGAQMYVPASPKVGAMRSSQKSILADRVYFVMFGNPACYIKAGARVTVVIGDFKAEGLLVGDLGGVAAR